MKNINGYSEAKSLFLNKDPAVMARNSGSVYDPVNNVIIISYMGHYFEVDCSTGEICGQAPWTLVKNDETLILQYLVTATGAKPREKWVSFNQLPDGPHHHVPFIVEAVTPLCEQFGDNIEVFRKKALTLGGIITKLGDCGMIIPVLPLIPLAVVFWTGDDELPTNANILFDLNAPLHLTTAALWVLGVELSRKLRGVIGQQYI